jgi:L-methionine (R)-S-oxide reductase
MQTVTHPDPAAGKAASYQQICEQLQLLLGNEQDLVANLANTSAYLAQVLPDVNWVGFYLLHGEELVLGPFQGKPACVRIRVGSGVCGTAARDHRTVLVPDVQAFPGHIACDTASRSEIVVPLLNWGRLIGVLDVDSPSLNRFDEEDQEGLECVASVLVSSLSGNDLPDFSLDAAQAC